MNAVRHLRALVAAAVLGALIVPAPSPGGAQTPPYKEPANLPALLKAASAEGTLTVAWGDIFGGATGAQRIIDAINKKYHLNLTVKYSPVAVGGAFQDQVAQEVAAGQSASSDILFHVRDLDLAKAVQPVDYRKYVPGLPDDVMYFGHRAVIAVSVLDAEEYSKKDIPADKVPKSFADFIKPEWKGKVATTVYQGGFGAYIGLPEVLGHDGMIRYYTALMNNVTGVTTCGESDRVVTGEFALFGLDCGDYEVRLRQRKGEQIAVIYPKEGTALTAFAPGIPITAPHPAVARLFISFMLTREGQDMLWDMMGADNYKLPGSHMGHILASLRKSGVKIIEVYGLDVTHPELRAYAKEINQIVNRAR